MAENNEDLDNEASEHSIVEEALQRFKLAEEMEQDNREQALDDVRFSAGEQWPEDVKRSRTLENRPCLTINRIPQNIHQLTNDQRQNRPSIKVSPFDDAADVETAKIYQGLIRHIEYSSNADIAYDTAFDGAVRRGVGYYKIRTDYVDQFSFNQEIIIDAIRNPGSIYLDPFHKKPDGSDAKWGFEFTDLEVDEFKRLYPDSEACKMQDWESLGNRISGWFQNKTIRVADYYKIEYEETEIVLLNTGESVDKSLMPKKLPAGMMIVKTRKSQKPVVRQYKINGLEILEETIFPGRFIPIIPCYGEIIDIEGKTHLESAVRHAKDPQRMYNYWASTETEMIALAPKAPFIGYAGQFKGFEEKWRTANSVSHPYLEVNPVMVNGQPAPLPQRNAFEPPVQAITNARMQSSEDIKSTLGIYDAALGNRSNESSGLAIQRRAAQAQTSNFHFIDNLTRSIRHGGRIIVEIIPIIYDTKMAVRILGEDGQPEIVRINEEFQKDGKTVNYQMNKGRYDVTVETGPSYATKRQEAAASMIDFTKVIPAQAAMISDLIAKNMDWPGASEIAERLRKTLPPGMAEDKKAVQVPPEIQNQLSQMDQVIQQLTDHLNQATEELRTKKYELESKERIEFAKIEADLKKEQAKLIGKSSLALLQAEIQDLQNRQNLVGMGQPIPNNFTFAEPTGPAMQQNQPTSGASLGTSMGENHVS